MIDREFGGLDFKDIVRHVKLVLKDRTQHLANGELSTEFYTVTDIALQTGKNSVCHSYERCYIQYKYPYVISMPLFLRPNLMDMAQSHD